MSTTPTGPAEHYLALLSADRPVEDFDELLHTSIEQGLDLTEARRLHDLALRARTLQHGDRRRESEVGALLETVADLAALKDVDDVLEAIVRRVRTLLGSDVSYLSLNDEEAGLTYMRVTHGIHSGEFRNVTLGFGEGLGGLVAQTAQPYATADYFKDERFQHTRTIDSAVGSEELRAILGVPLLLGRTVIGVLYAANHDARPFSREDVDLLTSFAAPAAVALDNARRIAETQAALRDLEETSALLRQNVEGVDRATQAHDRLAAVVLQGGSISDVAVELHEVLETGVLVVDSRGSVLAASEATGELGESDLELLATALRDNRTVVADGVSVAPVWAGGAPLAAVLLRREVDHAERRILERAATTAALIMVVQRSMAESESRMRGDLLVDLLVGQAGAGALTARASLLGVDLSRPNAVLVVDGADAGVRQVAAELAAEAPGLTAEVGERLVVVLADREPLAEARAVIDRARAQSRNAVGRVAPTVGAAGPVSGVEGVRAAYAEASRCLEALLTLGRRGDAADAASLGFVGLLMGKGDPVEHVRAVLGPVLRYDHERGTALVQTLETWLAEDRHLGRTGERLHVHPNTVTQRLDRIAQLLGPGWQAPERLLEVSLALRLRQVLPSSP